MGEKSKKNLIGFADYLHINNGIQQTFQILTLNTGLYKIHKLIWRGECVRAIRQTIFVILSC